MTMTSCGRLAATSGGQSVRHDSGDRVRLNPGHEALTTVVVPRCSYRAVRASDTSNMPESPRIMIDRGTGPGGTRDAGLDEEIGTVGRATADAVAGGPAATDAAA